MSNELTVINQEVGVMIPPEETLEVASQAAKALKRVVSLKTKPVILNGEQYLEFEDLQLLGQFYGYTVQTGDAAPVEIDGVKGAKAHADLINFRTGEIVGGAEAYCMRDEEKWNTRPKYEWQGEGDNRKRIKIGDEVVPWFQLASMAQTRAGAKAFRNRLAWVVVLAGYRPTPAEEMTESTLSSAVKERRTVDKSEHYCAEHNVNFFMKGKMKSFAHPVKDENGKDTGEWCHEHKTKEQEPVKRGEFVKEGRDILEESIEEAQTKAPPEPLEQDSEPLDEETKADAQTGGELDFDPDILMDDLKRVRWSNNTVKSYLKNVYKLADTEGTVVELVARLTKEQRKAFLGEVQERLNMA